MPPSLDSRPTLLCAVLLVVGALPTQAQGRNRSEDLDSILERAQTEQSRGEYAPAATDYARATRLQPTVAELWANRGLMEYLAGQTPASITSLQRASALNPKLVSPQLFLGKAYVDRSEPERALPFLERALALHSNDPEILATLALAQRGAHRFAEAALTEEAVLAMAPGKASTWFSLGMVSLEQIQDAGRSLALAQGQSVWAQALYADALLAQGRPAEASSIYKQVFATAFPAQLATFGRTLLKAQEDPEVFILPDASRRALHELNAGLAATVPAQDPCKREPASAGAQPLHAAACSYWRGDFAGSAAAAAQALAGAPADPEALYWTIKANELRAAAALARFEELAPRSAPTYDLVGDLLRQQRRPDQAIAQYTQALNLDPHDPAAQLGMAAAYLSIGKVDSALTTAKTALLERPDSVPLNLLVAEGLVQQRSFAEAQPYLSKCSAAPPELAPQLHRLLGRVYAAQGETAKAIQELLLALPSDRDGSLHFQISRLYRKAGAVAEAQKAEAAARVLVGKHLSNATIALGEPTQASPAADPPQVPQP